MTEFLARPRKAGTRYPHLPGSAGHSSPKKPAGLRRDRTLLFTRLGLHCGAQFRKTFPSFRKCGILGVQSFRDSLHPSHTPLQERRQTNYAYDTPV